MNTEQTARNAALYAKWKVGGWSISVLATEFGISPQRVNQIIDAQKRTEQRRLSDGIGAKFRETILSGPLFSDDPYICVCAYRGGNRVSLDGEFTRDQLAEIVAHLDNIEHEPAE